MRYIKCLYIYMHAYNAAACKLETPISVYMDFSTECIIYLFYGL